MLARFSLFLFVLVGCAETAKLPFESTVGSSPQLAEPNETLIPTVEIAPARGWPEGAKPVAAPGLEVRARRTERESRAG